MEVTLQELRDFLLDELEATCIEATGLAAVCSHAGALLESSAARGAAAAIAPSNLIPTTSVKTTTILPRHSMAAGASLAAEDNKKVLGHEQPPPELLYDKCAWKRWYSDQQLFFELRRSEPEARHAAEEARMTWHQRLQESSHSPRQNDECSTSHAYLVACSLARLCLLAVEEALPAPSRFLETRGVMRTELGSAGIGDGEDYELLQLFPLMALNGWLSRLEKEAAEVVPPFLEAFHRNQSLAKRTVASRLGTPSSVTIQEDAHKPHPLTLLRYLPSESATRSVMVASRRAARLEFEAEIACRCQKRLLPQIDLRLRSAQSGTEEPKPLDALWSLRVVEQLCSDKRALLKFWPSPVVQMK